jgi:LuxR family transcriptional regulator, maltose regulon positive regulatory protein
MWVGVNGVRNRHSRRYLASGPVFDPVSAKLRNPLLRPGTVRRSSLIERLERGDPCPVVSVVAPAGYGKTTLLSQWAESSGHAFAWVSVEELDNDPKVLLTHVAEALDAVEPIDEPVFQALASPISSVPGTVILRFGSAFMSMTPPVVLVLDDVHVLRNPECRAAVSALADHVPAGSKLVLAGRAQPPLRTARLRAEGRIAEIGPGDLSLTCSEAAALLRNAGVTLGEDALAELHRRTEGWPTGLYLAALCLTEGGPYEGAVASFDGGDRFVSDYIESEFLARISRRQRAFLTRTAVLERMCGPLCDTVLELSGSAATLVDLAQSNLLLVPLDRQGKWYRYHHLFRDMLLAELSRFEPELMPLLRRRAAAWCVRNDLPDAALEYSIAAGDVDEVADLVAKMGVPAYQQGRIATVRRWFQWLEDRDVIQERPILAAQGAIFAALTARPADAGRWADMVDRWRDAAGPCDPGAEAWAAALGAILCRSGVKQMRADADEAVRRFAADYTAAPVAALAQGLARVLSGDLDGADASFEDAVGIGERVGVHETVAVALCERALVAMAGGQWERAEDLTGQARSALRRAGMEESYATPLVCAVHARTAWHRGDVTAVCQELVRAQHLRPMLTYALPHLAVQARIELAGAHIAIADIAGARTLMQEVDELLRHRPDLGTLTGQAEALRARLSEERGTPVTGMSSLTAAELRLLPMLATHLSMPEIAAQMFLSRNTIRSQATSVYRKLGASSRSQAIARCRELGLLEW